VKVGFNDGSNNKVDGRFANGLANGSGGGFNDGTAEILGIYDGLDDGMYDGVSDGKEKGSSDDLDVGITGWIEESRIDAWYGRSIKAGFPEAIGAFSDGLCEFLNDGWSFGLKDGENDSVDDGRKYGCDDGIDEGVYNNVLDDNWDWEWSNDFSNDGIYFEIWDGRGEGFPKGNNRKDVWCSEEKDDFWSDLFKSRDDGLCTDFPNGNGP